MFVEVTNSIFNNNSYYDSVEAEELAPVYEKITKDFLINTVTDSRKIETQLSNRQFTQPSKSITRDFVIRGLWNRGYEEELSGSSNEVHFVGHEGFVGIFKPVCKDDGNRKGIPKHEEAIREVLACSVGNYLTQTMHNTGLNLGIKDFGVPHTELTHYFSGLHFNGSLGSFQEYIKGTPLEKMTDAELASIPSDEYRKLCVVDLILLNTDRHLGNLLLNPGNTLTLIDHGSTLPSTASLGKEVNDFDALTFHWKDIPFTNERLTDEWKEFIRTVSIKDLMNSMVKNLSPNRKLVVRAVADGSPITKPMPTTLSDYNYWSISSKAVFYSMASLYFMKYWVEKAGDQPLRELIHHYIPEQILYRYAKDITTGEITRIERRPEEVKVNDFRKSVFEWCNDREDAEVTSLTHKAQFIRLIKKILITLKEPGQPMERKSGQPKLTGHEVLANWDEIEPILAREFSKIDLTPTLEIARAKFGYA